MRWSDILRNPSGRLLRQFAGLWLVFFGGLACWQGLARHRVGLALALAGLALAVGLVGLLRPRAVRPVFVVWMVLAFPVGWAVAHALLAVVFYGLFTPLGLGFRLAGRDVLGLRRPAGRESYWVPKPAAEGVGSYFRQF
jgi:hypothetical protein